MVLRCSLLGHDFGEAEVEREREERGSEVVVTVQEYEECSRCGERTVISENTEVTSLSTGTDDGSLSDDHDPQPTEQPPETDAPADGIESDDAAFIDADATDGDAELVDVGTDPADSATGSATDPADPAAAASSDDESDAIDVPTDENGDPVTDDGEILEDDGEPSPDRDRDHGEWPDSDDVGPPVGADAEPAAWPDDGDAAEPDTVDEESGPTATDDDAVVLENDAPPARSDDARTVTAEPPAADRGDADTGTSASSASGTGIERADSVPTPAESSTGPSDDVPTEFYCPRCEYVAAGDRSSLRAGDICPDCRKGYLSERERR